MAKNRKNQAASVRFGPAVWALVTCVVIGGAAVGYVWQKQQIGQLGKQILAREKRLADLTDQNKKLRDQLAMLRSPAKLEQRARELNLGLGQPQAGSVWRLPEPTPALPEEARPSGQYAARRGGESAMP